MGWGCGSGGGVSVVAQESILDFISQPQEIVFFTNVKMTEGAQEKQARFKEGFFWDGRTETIMYNRSETLTREWTDKLFQISPVLSAASIY